MQQVLRCFINSVPHISAVWGENSLNVVKKSDKTVRASILFRDMALSAQPQQLKPWATPAAAANDEAEALPRFSCTTDSGVYAFIRLYF
ncbi:malate:quinone oxidoreductase [Pantoea sp. FN060301]|uniref:malate:quinone oxidoreductase n=1 Tax=Pantoea sp. FN060301 TaxID=3420380 RepID=UPI003D184248